MVEAYRSGGAAGEDLVPFEGPWVVGVIDIPGDEVALYLVDAPDAAAAGRLVVGRGLRPIRVVDVRWNGLVEAGEPSEIAGAADGNPAPETWG
jgi:hypothetical protein